MSTSDPNSGKPVILFDGVCNLCNGSVQFIIRRDPQQLFHFSQLQSNFGQQQMKNFGLEPGMLNSVILLEGGKLYQKSTAALRIAKKLSGLWPALYAFIIVPPFIRNWVYDFISKNRYRFFGKRDECMIPTPALKARFIQ